MAYRMVLNKEDAADIVRETFVQAFRKIHQFRFSSTFKTWLYRIAINKCKNFSRRLKQHQAHLSVEDYALADPDNSQLNALVAKERLRLISETIEKLPKKQKAILILRTYHGLSYKEIAEITGGSVCSARVNFHHAIENMKRLIGGDL